MAITINGSGITSSEIADGSITAADLDVGQLGGRRNLIINGAMQVAQRGTSATSGGYNSVDRFKVDYSGGTVTQSQESLSSGTPFELGFHKFYRATNTSVATDTAAHFRVLRHNIEDQNVANSGWNYKSSDSYITLSFWVRSSVSQEFYTYLNQGTDSYNYAFSIGTLAANTWTKITKTIPGNSNLTFDNDNSAGIELNIVPFWGTNFTTSGSTTDAWFAWNGASRVPDMTSTWATTSGATFDITGVQLEVGSVATPFEHRSYGEELALCQRYFQQVGKSGTFQMLSAQRWNSSALFTSLPFTVPMRANPTLGATTTSNVVYFSGNGQSGSSTILSFSLAGGVTSHGIPIIISVNFTPNNQYAYTGYTSDAGAITLDAEL
jgi:hypothetical protein